MDKTVVGPTFNDATPEHTGNKNARAMPVSKTEAGAKGV
jgi:hypothetical protein